MSIKGITPGRAYRAYRFPQRSGGRMSRRVSAVRPVGTFAGILSAALFAGTAFVGVCIAAVIGYFAADLPAAHDLATVPIPLATHIYDRTGQHLLYTLADEQRADAGEQAHQGSGCHQNACPGREECEAKEPELELYRRLVLMIGIDEGVHKVTPRHSGIFGEVVEAQRG